MNTFAPFQTHNLRFGQATKLRAYSTRRQDGAQRSERSISEEDILTTDPNFGLPKLISESALTLITGIGNGYRSALPTSHPVFENLLHKCRIPDTFYQAIRTRNGIMATFTEHEDVDERTNDETKPKRFTIIVQTPYAPTMTVSFALTIDCKDRSATGLFLIYNSISQSFSCYHPESDVGQEHEFIALVKAHPASMIYDNPLMLLCIFFDLYGRATEAFRFTQDIAVVKHERSTGMSALRIHPLVFDVDEGASYEVLIRGVHECNFELVVLETMMRFEEEFGKFCAETMSKFEDLIRPWNRPKTTCSNLKIQDHLNHIRSRSRHNLSQMQGLQKRIQLQISVLFSLVSQRDSRANIELAEESRKLAATAIKDSRTMKTIAVMTLVFLPATLVSSIFSTDVFDLGASPARGQNVVAPLWWIWAVVTSVLTFLVLVAAWAWNREHTVLK